MALIANFTTFRSSFAVHARYTPTAPDPVQFIGPDTIRRTAGGDWTADDDEGFQVGQRVQVVGSSSNDGYFTISSIPTTDELRVAETINDEGPLTSGVDFDGVFIDPGGYERFPADKVNPAVNGLGQLTQLPTPWTPLVVPNVLKVNAAYTQDATPFVDEYDWFVSQRTEDPSKQLLEFTDRPPVSGDTFSGIIGIEITTLGFAETGASIGVPLTPFQTAQLFKNVDVYVKSLLGAAKLNIQFTNLLVYSTTVEFP